MLPVKAGYIECDLLISTTGRIIYYLPNVISSDVLVVESA